LMALGYVHKSARLLDAHLKRVHGAADSDKTITIEPSCLAGVIVKSALAEVRISMALKPQRLSKCTPWPAKCWLGIAISLLLPTFCSAKPIDKNSYLHYSYRDHYRAYGLNSLTDGSLRPDEYYYDPCYEWVNTNRGVRRKLVCR